MPYEKIPENPQNWQNARVPRWGLSRGIRQLLILDMPFLAALTYFFCCGNILVPRLKFVVGILSSLLLILCVVFLWRIARNFLMELFRPTVGRREIGGRVWNRLWGWHQVLFRKYILINSCDSIPSDHWSRWLGGPAYLIIYDGFAVYLEYGNGFHRVVGPGFPIPYLDSRETIKAIVDLRPQFREFDANSWTKDGIKVILGVRVESRIGADFSPEKADRARLYPFDRISVRQAVEYTAVREHNGKLIEVDWCEGVTGKIKGLLAHYISSHRLDELFLINKGNVQVLSPGILKQIYEEANKSLKRVGIHVSNIQIIKTQIPNDVYGQRLDVWKAGRDSLATRIHGEGHAYEIRVNQEVLSKAQRELIVTITRNLEKIDPSLYPETTLLSLSKVLDQGMKDPLVRTFMTKETLSLIERLLR